MMRSEPEQPALEIVMSTLSKRPGPPAALLALKFAVSFLAACFLLIAPALCGAEGPAQTVFDVYVPTKAELQAGYERAQQASRGRPPVYKAEIRPHWLPSGARFWYRNDLPGGRREFILVDAEHRRRSRAFDHDKLATALSKATGKNYQGDRLPFDSIDLSPDAEIVRFTLDATTWQVALATYVCSPAKPPASPAPRPVPPAEPSPPRNKDGSPFCFAGPEEGIAEADDEDVVQPRGGRVVAPDGKWTAFVKEHNIHLRSADGKEIQLSHDGKAGLSYGMLRWAQDSKTLAAFRIEPGSAREVYLIESSPRGGGRARLHRRPYDLPGDKLTSYELNLFQVDGARHIKPEVERIDLDFPRLRWSSDGSKLTVEKTDRGHQRFRLIEVAAGSGAVRNLIDEHSKTFIWTAHREMLRLPLVTWLKKTNEIIYVSEQDGWRHLYLIDADAAKVKNQITRGEWVVRGIEHIDEDRRQVWFRASGKVPGQDPYLIHFYRINFDGAGLVALTEGNGSHTIQFSPERKYLIDTYSRIDMAPVHELRSASDGKLICPLEKADTSELGAAGWTPPEVFTARGRDGTTDIWGIIARPRHLVPGKKYPVLESIYAGPQGSFVPKSFSPFSRFTALTELGFIVVQIDGMGTANRSKAFHDVCWHHLEDAGLQDRIAWHQAAARKYPYYDLQRVGIFGTSAGGQNAAGAVLLHPDFYKAAVAACGCHDNRMDKASWNEQWMGYPVGPHYAASSNITHAANLRGKLLLIVGELDDNVPPESTYRFADALIKAGKDFEFLVLPGLRHTNGGPYGVRRMQDFFVRHLHGVEPPDRNAAAPARRDATAAPAPAVSAPPEAFFEKMKEGDRAAARRFYRKYLDTQGVPVAAAAEVDDLALQRTHDLVTHLLAGRPDVLETMVKHGTRLIIIGKDQVYTDMPEYRNHPNPSYQNERVRGTGGFDVTSFGEENLLNLPLDRYDDESIAVHEFCHTIDAALARLDPAWRERLVQTYRSAIARGLWKNTYAATNPAEYWAEICQSYFDCNRVNNWNHGPIGTREQLAQYDPDGYELVKAAFRLTGEKDWRYQPLRRQPSVIRPPARFHVPAYYTKFSYAREFMVLGSDKVSDEALLAANDVIRKMFAYRHDLLKALISDGARLVVLGRTEKLRDLSELQAAPDRDDFDAVRYLDYTPKSKLIVVPEENVLGLPSDPVAGRCLIVGALARAVHQVAGLRPADPEFERRRGKQQYELRVKRLDIEFDRTLQKLHEQASSKGLWKGTPAARSRFEYWAAGVEAYFDAAGDGQPPDLSERPITTREALKAYDPGLYALVDETMAYRQHVDWRYRRPSAPGGHRG
jgi:dipeptidyl aminopeptidase/acylaminoacyl peptidase